jgi:hypothetical protein
VPVFKKKITIHLKQQCCNDQSNQSKNQMNFEQFTIKTEQQQQIIENQKNNQSINYQMMF